MREFLPMPDAISAIYLTGSSLYGKAIAIAIVYSSVLVVGRFLGALGTYGPVRALLGFLSSVGLVVWVGATAGNIQEIMTPFSTQFWYAFLSAANLFLAAGGLNEFTTPLANRLFDRRKQDVVLPGNQSRQETGGAGLWGVSWFR